MKFNTVIAALSVAAAGHVALAMPADKRGAISDIDVLNFALSLEHLESAFYSQYLGKYTTKDFADAGHPKWVRDRFTQIASHEQEHVDFLSKALGAKAVKACEYKFPVNNVKSFIYFTNLLEQVGTSAYTGAARYLNNKDYLTAASTILTVEARHTAWIDSSVKMSSAWGEAFDIPLDPNQAYSAAKRFIKECPKSNTPIPFKSFPHLVLSIPNSQPKSITVEFGCESCRNKPLFAAFLTSHGVTSRPLEDIKRNRYEFKAEVVLPEGMMGYIYLFISDDPAKVNDHTTMAGPAVLEYSVNSHGKIISVM